MEERYEFSSMIRGYHEYQSIWTAEIGEELSCARDVRNSHDPYAVSVKKGITIVGHVPRSISCVCFTFLRRGGNIRCVVTGQRRYSADLPQGGLEIPCLLEFIGNARDVALVTKLLTTLDADGHGLSNSSTVNHPEDSQPPSKKFKVDVSTNIDASQDKKSVQRNTTSATTLMEKEYENISSGEKLSDLSMNEAQKLLKTKFSHINGLRSTLLQNKKSNGLPQIAENKIQIVHCRSRDHWIVASSVGLCNEVGVYDSLFNNLDNETESVLAEIFPGFARKMLPCQKQSGGTDCGLFAIANATSIAFSKDHEFNQHNMRDHLLSCFKNNSIVPFP